MLVEKKGLFEEYFGEVDGHEYTNIFSCEVCEWQIILSSKVWSFRRVQNWNQRENISDFAINIFESFRFVSREKKVYSQMEKICAVNISVTTKSFVKTNFKNSNFTKLFPRSKLKVWSESIKSVSKIKLTRNYSHDESFLGPLRKLPGRELFHDSKCRTRRRSFVRKFFLWIIRRRSCRRVGKKSIESQRLKFTLRKVAVTKTFWGIY